MTGKWDFLPSFSLKLLGFVPEDITRLFTLWTHWDLSFRAGQQCEGQLSGRRIALLTIALVSLWICHGS